MKTEDSSRVIRLGRIWLFVVLLAVLAVGISSVSAFAGSADEVRTLKELDQSEGLGEAIAGMPVLDHFGRQEVPLEGPEWVKTRWTGELGGSWRAPWHGYGATLSHHAGTFWRPTRFSGAYEPVAVAATLGTGPIYERWPNEYLSLWLNMPRPGKVRSGYEVRFRGANRSASDYTVELSKWISGQRTVLARRHGVSLPVDSTFAVSDTLGMLEVWTGEEKLAPILSGIDLTFKGGYAGIEANRGEGTAYNFRAGNVTGETSR